MPDAGASLVVDSPSTQGSSGAQTEQPSTDVNLQPVQGTGSEQSIDDILKGLPSVDELNEQAGRGEKYAAGLANLRGRIEPLNTQFSELQTKFTPFEDVISRFEQPDALKSALDLHDSMIGWERDASTGELVPATSTGAERLAKDYPQHADFLAADLLNMPTIDRETGRTVTRMDLALEAIAKNPERRAATLKILGAVEPSSISPQWQATEEELGVVRPELQEVYKRLPYEERVELATNAPDFINRVLEREKFTQDLQAEREQSQQAAITQQAQREQYIAHQAAAAGDSYVQSELSNALTTFHQSVVEQCNFIAPLDMAALPQGMSAEQATTMNQQIAASNKAEAAQISMAVIGLVNPQTRPFVLPLLQQIGVVDDKLIKELESASSGFGDNARNYGELTYRGRLTANGNGFNPDASMTGLGNAAKQNLNKMVHFANQVKTRLMEQRSQFFSMKATDHNQTLNNVAGVRPMGQGSSYDPTTAAAPRPSGWATRQELERQYGA